MQAGILPGAGERSPHNLQTPATLRTPGDDTLKLQQTSQQEAVNTAGTGWLTKIRLKRKWATTQVVRLLVQIGFLAVTVQAIVRHRLGESQGLSGPANQAPGVDSLSPFGGLETLWIWATTGNLLNHLHVSDLILLLASVILVVLMGSAFCGWICPLGTIQEWLYRLRTRLIPWKITIGPKVDRWLRNGRYIVLALALYATYSMGELIFGEYCPWRAASHIGSDEIAIGGAIVLGLLVVGGLLVERAWCRYACPLGAFLGLANKLPLVRLRRTESACTACGLCNKKCPLDLEIAAVTDVTETTCNRCLECVDSCPKEGALEVKASWWRGARSIKGWTYGALVAAIFTAVIVVSMLTGDWQATASGAPPQAEAATGQVSPDEIKGWRTLKEVVEIWGIPQEVLYRELALDPASTPPSTPIKELEGLTTPQGVELDRTLVVEIVRKWQQGELK